MRQPYTRIFLAIAAAVIASFAFVAGNALISVNLSGDKTTLTRDVTSGVVDAVSSCAEIVASLAN